MGLMTFIIFWGLVVFLVVEIVELIRRREK